MIKLLPMKQNKIH